MFIQSKYLLLVNGYEHGYTHMIDVQEKWHELLGGQFGRGLSSF